MLRFKDRFGAQVRKLRRQRGLSQEELAARAGLHKNYISGIERGVHNVSLENACKLASCLGVTVSHLSEPTEEQRARTPSEADRLRSLISEKLKGHRPERLNVILDVVKVLTRKR